MNNRIPILCVILIPVFGFVEKTQFKMFQFSQRKNDTEFVSISYFIDGGVEETRTLAPVNPIYFLSREAPSPTWVLLQSERPLY